MIIRPATIKEANAFVVKEHRHSKEVTGAKYAIKLVSESELLGVSICGRPTGRHSDDGVTIEILRVCVKDGVLNGCSKLYGASARIAKEMGYKKAITYTKMSESGVSLIASGWVLDATNVGGKSWNSSGGIVRSDKIIDLFGERRKYPNELKKRWVKKLCKL